MKGSGFLLLLALNLACNQGAVFDYSHISESVSVFNGDDEGEFCIEAHGYTNVSEIIRAPDFIYSGEVTDCDSQVQGPMFLGICKCVMISKVEGKL